MKMLGHMVETNSDLNLMSISIQNLWYLLDKHQTLPVLQDEQVYLKLHRSASFICLKIILK